MKYKAGDKIRRDNNELSDKFIIQRNDMYYWVLDMGIVKINGKPEPILYILGCSYVQKCYVKI